MFRQPASRSILRLSRRTVPRARLVNSQRFINTSPANEKSRSWKSTAVRWGLAAAAVYYYNTSTLFAEEPSLSLQPASGKHGEEDDDLSLPTIESVAAANKKRKAARAAREDEARQSALSALPVPVPSDDAGSHQLSAEELEDEAGQEGAFNPETGEINWDCPCLGGMAHGPCGEDFRAAFSCFVYSKEEPKGMDCIDKFKGMQDCFRQHPDIYGSELDEETVDEQLNEHIASESESHQKDESSPGDATGTALSPTKESLRDEKVVTTQNPKTETVAAHQQEPLVGGPARPNAWHVATEKNEAKK